MYKFLGSIVASFSQLVARSSTLPKGPLVSTEKGIRRSKQTHQVYIIRNMSRERYNDDSDNNMK